ncbi:MAG: MFS transporter, partial [Desulfovibrio sp.]|nr:MFS transporter [Desulfovibrio sp.]
GLHAGSICGVAIGGMLAERLGYNQVFGISSLIFAALAFFLFYCYLNGGAKATSVVGILHRVFRTSKGKTGSGRRRPKRSSLGIRPFLSRQSLIFVLAIVVPLTMIKSGVFEFLLPVLLSTSYSQGDIGRIFMLNSLIVVIFAPLCGSICSRFACYRLGVMVSLGLSITAVLAFLSCPLLEGAIVLTVLLGLATALSIPANSEYLLNLPKLSKVSTSSSMTWLSIFERLGDVAGPVAIGAAMTWVGLALTSVGVCLLFGATGIFFCVASLRPKKESSAK